MINGLGDGAVDAARYYIDAWDRNMSGSEQSTTTGRDAAALRAVANETHTPARHTGDSAVDSILDILNEICDSNSSGKMFISKLIERVDSLTADQIRKLRGACDLRRRLMLNHFSIWNARTRVDGLNIVADDVCVNFVWLEKATLTPSSGPSVEILDRFAETASLPSRYMENLVEWAKQYRTNLLVYRSTQEFKDACRAHNINVIGI